MRGWFRVKTGGVPWVDRSTYPYSSRSSWRSCRRRPSASLKISAWTSGERLTVSRNGTRADHVARGRPQARRRSSAAARVIYRGHIAPARGGRQIKPTRRLRRRRGRAAERHALRPPAHPPPRPVRPARRARAALRPLARREAPPRADQRVGVQRPSPARLRHRHLPRPRRSSAGRHTLSGRPLDAFGRNVYIDVLRTDGWFRIMGVLTRPRGFALLIRDSAWRGSLYRAMVPGPNINGDLAPDVTAVAPLPAPGSHRRLPVRGRPLQARLSAARTRSATSALVAPLA